MRRQNSKMISLFTFILSSSGLILIIIQAIFLCIKKDRLLEEKDRLIEKIIKDVEIIKRMDNL